LIRKSEQELTTSRGRDDVWDVANKVLHNDPKVKRVEAVNDDTLIATTKRSWGSWGEIVTIQIKEKSSGQVTLLVSSRTRLKTTVIDYGANRRTLNRVITALSVSLDGTTP
jgi:hypothetical protein